jgi:predicted nucleic acid-binding protein
MSPQQFMSHQQSTIGLDSIPISLANCLKRNRARCKTRIVANAEGIYADPSALIKLYLKEPESRAVAAWRGNFTALPITRHGKLELMNGIGLAAYRGVISEAAYEGAMAALDDDFASGRFTPTDLLWRAALQRAGEISGKYTRLFGVRSLDVIHVASAVELGMQTFVTCDLRQQQLASALKLNVVRPE